MSNARPFVSIIIPNFNGRLYAEECLRSVLSSDYPNFEVIVVDDCSTDGSAELLETTFSTEARVRIYKNNVNRGAAGARNVGVKLARGSHLCFLDNDTKVEPTWLIELVRLIGDDSVGAVQSVLLEFDDPDIIQVAGISIIPQIGWGIARHRASSYRRVSLAPAEVCALTTALLIKRQALLRAGGLDEKLSIFTEDIDLSWRIWLAGYRILLAPESKVHHRTKPMSERVHMHTNEYDFNFHLVKNALRTLTKNYELKNLIRYLPWAILVIMTRGILTLARRKNASVIRGTFKAATWNILQLQGTVRERLRVQRIVRRARDDEVFPKIMVSGSPLHIYRKYFGEGAPQ